VSTLPPRLPPRGRRLPAQEPARHQVASAGGESRSNGAPWPRSCLEGAPRWWAAATIA